MHSGQCSRDISTSEECTDPDGNSADHGKRRCIGCQVDGGAGGAGHQPRDALLQICGIVVARSASCHCAMVLVEELDALDLLIWLGGGAAVARRLGCDQSTISRRSRHCQQVFNLRLQRHPADWPLEPNNPLLLLQREVHQLYRCRMGQQLRIDASLLAAPLLRPAPPEGWIPGHLDRLGWRRPLQLLKARILDAWITAMGQELSRLDRDTFCALPLARTPLLLAGQPDHPLLHHGQLTPGDVRHIPRLAPRQGRYPRTEALLGDWRRLTPSQPMPEEERAPTPASRTVRLQRPGPGDLTLHYRTGFSLANQGMLRALPLDLGVSTELTLVLRARVIGVAGSCLPSCPTC